MDPVSLILGLIPLFGGLFGGGKDSAPTTATTDPAMSEMLDLQRRRMSMQDPLYEAITRMAMGLMPTAYQKNIPMTFDPNAQYRRDPNERSTTGPTGASGSIGSKDGPASGGGTGGGGMSWGTPETLRDSYNRRMPPQA